MSVYSNALFSLESRALEYRLCHAGHAYITGFWLLSVARERVQPVHLTYPAHGSLSACPLPAAGTLTEMTRTAQPAIIIFLWPPKCTWDKGKINLCHRPYSKINSHAVTELYVKWSYSSTERHISLHYIPSFIGLDSEYSFCT